jgi:hypothetical protein
MLYKNQKRDLRDRSYECYSERQFADPTHPT